jgi:hypothetical protein
MMKKILFACTIIFSALMSAAQSWNPYVAQGIISPAPLLTVQLKGTGVASFNIGNTGSSPLTYDPGILTNNMLIVISLSGGLPNVSPLDSTEVLTTIGGTWAKLFTWQYDKMKNAFTGIQNQIIPGQSQGSITIQYKVSQNSPKSQPKNGLKVKLIPPPYAQVTNSTNDDTVSCYTFTETRDSGDAPK